MPSLRSATLAAIVAVATVASSAQAATFDFFWTGNPSLDPTLFTSSDATAKATGKVIIARNPGESFNEGDVTLVSIRVTGANYDFTGNEFSSLIGTIAADGLSAALTDLALVIRRDVGIGDGTLYCDSGAGDCEADNLPSRNITILGAAFFAYFLYDSTASAQASYKLTAAPGDPAPVPVAAALPLLLGGLGALAALRRRRR